MTLDETLGSNLTDENIALKHQFQRTMQLPEKKISYLNYFYRTALELSVRFIKQM